MVRYLAIAPGELPSLGPTQGGDIEIAIYTRRTGRVRSQASGGGIVEKRKSRR